MSDDLSTEEQLAYQYAAKGKTQQAVRLLFELIVKYAKAKNFPKAEALRDKLFDIDAMALSEIIKAADIIEEEKSVAIDRNHLDIWAGLHKTLTKEESNALYFSLKTAQYGPDEVIFKQGSRNERLYFINHGQLKSVYSQSGRETLIRTVEPGMIVGEDTFFFITFCTTSLITISKVRLSYLEREDFQKWQGIDAKEESHRREGEFVSLASKLADYCTRMKKNYDAAAKSFNRRMHKRVSVSGPILFQVLNASGAAIGKPYKGELSDISVGGLSFFIKTASQKNALMLLGRKVDVNSGLSVGDSHIDVARTGTVIGVINHLFSDYSVHVRFDDLLSDAVVEKLGTVSKNNADKADGVAH